MYLKYFLYIIQHKWYVFIECLKIMQPLHGITHDLSKFLPSEFISYAKYFYGDYGVKNNCPAKWSGSNDDIFHTTKRNFDCAWLLHQHRNKHHWDYWVKSDNKPIPMPSKYVMQMIADWRAMSKKFNDTAQEFYLKNKDKMILHKKTIEIIEYVLKI